MGATDFRFRTKGKILCAFVEGWPAGDLLIKSLGSASPQKPARITAVQILGREQRLQFTQAAQGLRVTQPVEKPATADLGIALKVSFA